MWESAVTTGLAFSPLLRRTGAFNEATPFQVWIPYRRDTVIIPHDAFNEATPFQVWIQDGRGRSCRPCGAPSTKPHPFRCGYLSTPLSKSRLTHPSTKPHPFRCGYSSSSTSGTRSMSPSTKPHPFRCGYRRSLRSAGYWGHFREPPAQDPQDLESRAGHAFRAEVLFGGESGFSAPFEHLRDEVSPPHCSQASTT